MINIDYKAFFFAVRDKRQPAEVLLFDPPRAICLRSSEFYKTFYEDVSGLWSKCDETPDGRIAFMYEVDNLIQQYEVLFETKLKEDQPQPSVPVASDDYHVALAELLRHATGPGSIRAVHNFAALCEKRFQAREATLDSIAYKCADYDVELNLATSMLDDADDENTATLVFQRGKERAGTEIEQIIEGSGYKVKPRPE